MGSAPRYPGAKTVDELRSRFLHPHPDSRPTPFFWWSGADLERERLSATLDLLAEKAVGGTIIGYSQHPDNELDAGEPKPFTPAWWELLRWYCDESAKRGLLVGVQDYGIIGSVLLGIGDDTSSLHGGSLANIAETVVGPVVHEVVLGERRMLAAIGWAVDDPDVVLSPERTTTGVRWHLPEGNWTLSVVTVEPGVIAGHQTRFDPLHPKSGALVIDRFYESFAQELGSRLGGTFRFIFQDELNLGVVMPMFDDQIVELLRARGGFEIEDWIHALWHNRGPRTIEFRAAYRDIVVELLESHYFRPIFQWHRAHGTQMLMDQLSRGDLRLGAQHYGDFLDVMRWYDGPGNDDPDLTGPRNIAAFLVSSSIANLNDRPYVPNEAFHSSGWGIMPGEIMAGAAVGFAAGANHLIMHGLEYTSNAGWWEWASPDFHFRQPWWRHSDGMWKALARITEFVRAGDSVRDVAILDPSSDVALSGNDVTSPELAHDVLERLALAGIDPEMVPPSMFADASVPTAVATTGGVAELLVGNRRYRAVVIPGVLRLRARTNEILQRFADAGGLIITVDRRPLGTEHVDFSAAELRKWRHVPSTQLIETLRRMGDLHVSTSTSSVLATHRQLSDAEIILIANSAETAQNVDLGLHRSDSLGRLERWDPWTGEVYPVIARYSRTSVEVKVQLGPGESALFAVVPGEPAIDSAFAGVAGETLNLDGPWLMELQPSLDNRFGDFEVGRKPIGVSSWRIEEARSQHGPWSPAQVDAATRFYVLGPVPHALREEADSLVSRVTAVRLDDTFTLGDLTLSWRPYRFSEASGVVGDPLLRDRMTGPHGLKGVPDEFLDPTVLDADAKPGDSYYFWSSVSDGWGEHRIQTASRAAYEVWFDGKAVIGREHEEVAAFHPPWGLRDMSTSTMSVLANAASSRPPVAVRIVVADGQPTRVAVWVDGTPPEVPEPALLRWWQGPDPSLHFEPAVESGDDEVWLRAVVPPGSTSVTMRVAGTVTALSVSDSDAVPTAAAEFDGEVSRYEVSIPIPTSDDVRTLTWAVSPARNGSTDAGVLRDPLRWNTVPQPVRLLPWPELGLGDYSGVARYTTRFTLPRSVPFVELRLGGLAGTARVEINGATAGHILTADAVVRIDADQLSEENTLTVEVANTLSNFYAHLPSPYSTMQMPSGGFTSAHLELGVLPIDVMYAVDG